MTKKVLVVGDTILDIYCYGVVDRISPEAPVPVLDYQSEEHVLGGACNVAANIRTLLRDSDVQIDYYGFYSLEIGNLLKAYDINCVGIPLAPEGILTKTRYVCNKIQLLRVDNHRRYSNEDLWAINALTFKNINFSEYDLIVVSDYDKNTITENEFDVLAEQIDVPKIIDLKRVRSDMMCFENCILKCNIKEYNENDHIIRLGVKVVVTTGDKGYWFPQSNERFPRARVNNEVIDVVGAGDVFLAGMAVNYLESGALDLYAMSAFGNICANEKVKHFGTVAVKRSLL